MNGHFGTRSLNDDGTWKDLMKIKKLEEDLYTETHKRDIL